MLGDDGCVIGSGAVFDEGGLDGTGSGKGAAWFLEGSDVSIVALREKDWRRGTWIFVHVPGDGGELCERGVGIGLEGGGGEREGERGEVLVERGEWLKIYARLEFG